MFVNIFHSRLLCLPVLLKNFTVQYPPSKLTNIKNKKMFAQVKLLVTIITILIYFSNEIHGDVLDKSRVSKSSMVRHTVNSMEVSTKINPTLPLILPQTKQQSNTHLIPNKIVEATNVKRKGKIFSDLSFLTGLGIGSLATSAIIPSGTKLSSPTISERLQPPFSSTSMDPPTTTIATQPFVSTTGQQFSLAPTVSHELTNVFDQTHPYYLSLTNNNLLYQTLRSMQDLLERLKTPLKESSKVESSSAALTPSSSFMNDKPPITWHPDVSNELNESDGTSEIRVINKSDEQNGIFNCSALKDIIRETIKENNVFNEQRQADQMVMVNETTTESATTLPDVTTTILPPSTTQIPPPQSTTTAENFGYYGGHAQNLSGISFVSPPYPSTSYGYPNSIHNAYGPPIYPSETFHHPSHHHHHQQHQEYYHPEVIEEYPTDAFINSGNHYSSAPEQWQIYPPYAKARKLSRADNEKLIIGRNGFVPSRKIG